MNETIEVYLELSERIRKLLAQNNVSVNDILRRENIDACISYAESPFFTNEDINTRNIVTKIAISAVSLHLLASAFVNVANALKNDSEIARETWFKLEPIINPKTGEILRDKKGEIIFNKIPQLELSQTRSQESKTEVKLAILRVLSISFKSEDKENNE